MYVSRSRTYAQKIHKAPCSDTLPRFERTRIKRFVEKVRSAGHHFALKKEARIEEELRVMKTYFTVTYEL